MSKAEQKPDVNRQSRPSLPAGAPPANWPAKETGSANKKLHLIFSSRQLRSMAYASWVIVLLVCCFIIVKPNSLEFDVVRVTICLLISLQLSIFFFVFWPQELEMKVIPLVHLPVRVTGPIVLWVIVLALLLVVIPNKYAHWAFYIPKVNNQSVQVPYHRGIEIGKENGEDLIYHLVEKKGRGQLGSLEGVFIQFRPGEDSIKANLHIPGYNPMKVTLYRDKDVLDLPELKPE